MKAEMKAEIKERPILFSGPMVKAILDGRKTQTRRVVNHGKRAISPSGPYIETNGIEGSISDVIHHCQKISSAAACKYGKPGDRLWVREAFYPIDDKVLPQWAYRADFDPNYNFQQVKFKPSIFMPREASRITLEITGVRVERLQDISEGDAKAEGLNLDTCREIFDVAAGAAKTKPACYVRGVDDDESGPDYCLNCAKRIAKKEKGQIVNYDGGDSDGPMYCHECRTCISLTLTDYGIEREIWLEGDDAADRERWPVSGNDARIAFEIAWQEYETDSKFSGRLAQVAYSTLWNKINGKKHPWESNPWVWVIGFKQV